jgi:3D (Asp-Asp-Asp) domain-containing protein
MALGLLAILVSVGAPTIVEAVDELSAGSSAIVAGTDGSGLRVRSGPGRSHKVVAMLPEGATVQVLAGPVTDGEADWYQVTTGGPISGWAVDDFLRPSSANVIGQPVLTSMSAQPAMSAQPTSGRMFVAKMTAYADGVDGIAKNARTATGASTRWGVVAVDPRFVPLGSTMLIDGYGDKVFVAEDVGSAIKGPSIDIWLPDGEQAKKYGTQYRKVTILTEGKRT